MRHIDIKRDLAHYKHRRDMKSNVFYKPDEQS